MTRKQLPNLLSVSRIPSSALFLVVFSTSVPQNYWVAVVIAVIALATDFADGYLARKWECVSEAGYFLDGLGDKCFTISFCLVIPRQYPEFDLLMWALIVRELLLYGIRAIDSSMVENFVRLRKFSLWQAGSIRVMFGVFFLMSGMTVYGYDIPGLVLGFLYVSAGSAIVFGWTTVVLLARALAREET